MERVEQNELNQQVTVKQSLIPNSGNGLFACKDFGKGEVICTYGGSLIDSAEAQYENPMYMVSFENGKGYKLMGDNRGGDLGHFANAVHPSFPGVVQNARFELAFGEKTRLLNERGRFKVVAVKPIKQGEEIIVNYGNGYWLTMKQWESGSHPTKPATVVARDERALKRRRFD
jgi:hypothetical protein